MDVYDEYKCTYLYNSYGRSLVKNIKIIEELRQKIFTRVDRMQRICKHLTCDLCTRRWKLAYNTVNGRFIPKNLEYNYDKVNLIIKNKKRCLMRRRNNWASTEVYWTKLVLELVNKKKFYPILNEDGSINKCVMCLDPGVRHNLPIDKHDYPYG